MLKMRATTFLVLSLVLLPFAQLSAYADTQDIGSAAPFAVLGEAGVTNAGSSVITGDVAGSIGTYAITGFPPGIVNAPYSILPSGAPQSVFDDATTAYTYAAGESFTSNLTGQNLGGMTLAPGVYEFDTTAGLSGLLTLNAGGNNAAQWVFQIGSALNTDPGSGVQVVNAGAPGAFNGGITWQVTSAATLDTTTAFLGTIISKAGDVVKTGATIGCGRVISLDGSVTLDTNVIDTPADCTVIAGTGGTGGRVYGSPPPTGTPEPGTFLLLGFGFAGLLGMARMMRAEARTRSA